MDLIARAFLAAYRIHTESHYMLARSLRYESFDQGPGSRFERGELNLTDLHTHALSVGEPELISGRHQWLENEINRFI
jgi:xylose isomerase